MSLVIDIVRPVISYEQIRNHADRFLEQYHPSRTIPIPIEEIIELQMGINIIPLPGLRQVFEIDGFISSDLSNISVDEFVYSSYPGRYRFTLAHEIGHIALHKEIYQQLDFTNSQEWKDFVNSIPLKTHSWLEYQAYDFGGLVLVPREHLKRLTDDHIKLIDSEGIPLKENWDFAWEIITAQLAKDFDVSRAVIGKRLKKDALLAQYR